MQAESFTVEHYSLFNKPILSGYSKGGNSQRSYNCLLRILLCIFLVFVIFNVNSSTSEVLYC